MADDEECRLGRETEIVSGTCDIHPCDGPQSYLVGKLDNRRLVCVRCMKELVMGFGWKLLGGQVRSDQVADSISRSRVGVTSL